MDKLMPPLATVLLCLPGLNGSEDTLGNKCAYSSIRKNHHFLDYSVGSKGKAKV
jgi:hypothetical protein